MECGLLQDYRRLLTQSALWLACHLALGAKILSLLRCLQKGHEPAELSITGEDGKTWDVTSKSVKLDEHVGHQVTLTGSARRESKAQEKAEEKKEGQVEKAAGKEEDGDLRVTDLKMVSETCSK